MLRRRFFLYLSGVTPDVVVPEIDVSEIDLGDYVIPQ